jgi:hypothetical protein
MVAPIPLPPSPEIKIFLGLKLKFKFDFLEISIERFNCEGNSKTNCLIVFLKKVFIN